MPDQHRPNIVMVITHDTGDQLGCYGHPVATPHLDALAAEGLCFDRYFCTAPQCSPSRASILTGLYPHTNGMMGLAHRGWELYTDVRCLPQYLAAAGYHTHLFGFQHEASDPHRLGYEQVIPATRRADGVSQAVADFLDARPTGPFFVMAGFTEAHRPFDQPGYEADPPEQVRVPPYLPDLPPIRREIGQLQGLVKAIDRGVGRILAALERHPARENTLFIYTTDHGIAMPRAKGMLYDPGVRTALLMRWPAGVPGGRRIDALLSNVDLLPTLLEAARAPLPAGLHGRSFLPLLMGFGCNVPAVMATRIVENRADRLLTILINP
ncbi:MAG TPA: sulfatase-like hydrolase/transferase, partial [Limnochordia bacterium]